MTITTITIITNLAASLTGEGPSCSSVFFGFSAMYNRGMLSGYVFIQNWQRGCQTTDLPPVNISYPHSAATESTDAASALLSRHAVYWRGVICTFIFHYKMG